MNMEVICEDMMIDVIKVDEIFLESAKRKPGGNSEQLQYSGSKDLWVKYPMV